MDSNELLNKVLAENIEKASNGVGQAIDFTVDQAPEVIQQVLMWAIVSNVIGTLFSLAVFIASILSLSAAWKMKKRNIGKNRYRDDSYEDPDVFYAFGSIACFFSLIGAACFFTSAIKPYIAPKVWLIEYAASLIK